MRTAMLLCVLLATSGCEWSEKSNKEIIDRALAECVHKGYSAIRVTFILGMASNFRECVNAAATSAGSQGGDV